MKPIIILPPDAMSKENIDVLRENGICVVVATNPAEVKFVDPIPSASSRTEIENAAIQLSRRLLNYGVISGCDYKSTFAAMFVDLLVKGTPLDKNPTQEERDRQAFRDEKDAELRRLAREEAKQERDAKKAKK